MKRSKLTLAQFLQKNYWVIVASLFAILIAMTPAPSWSTNVSQQSITTVVEQKTDIAQQPGWVEPSTYNNWKIDTDAGVVNFNIVKTATFPHIREGVQNEDVFYAQLVCDDLNPNMNFKQNRLHDRSKMIKFDTRWDGTQWINGKPYFSDPVTNIGSLSDKYWEQAHYMREPLKSQVLALCGIK